MVVKNRGDRVIMKKFTKDQDFWTNQYKTQANMPIIWYMTAEKLRSSYQVLAEHANKMFNIQSQPTILKEALNNTLPSSLMLAGYSIENYLKGLIVKNSTLGAFDKNGNFALKSHNLVLLASKAGLKLNKDEQELLERLNYFVMSGGRYPIPLNDIDMQPVYFNDGGIGPIGAQRYNNNKMTYDIYEKIDLFFERLKEICPIES